MAERLFPPTRPFRRTRIAVGAFLIATTAASLAFNGVATAQTVETIPTPPDATQPFVEPTQPQPTSPVTAPAATSAPPATTAPPPTAAPPATTAPAPAAPPTAAPPTAAPRVAPATTRRPTATSRPRSVVPVITRPKAASTGAIPKGPTSIIVDIRSQRLMLYKSGKLVRTLRVSTGNGRRYCEKGRCGVAVTPRGRFTIYNRINGWRTSYLGRLYNPLYFRGGYAIHGSNSVPSYPASHGCVRVSISDANYLARVVPNGTSVWVR